MTDSALSAQPFLQAPARAPEAPAAALPFALAYSRYLQRQAQARDARLVLVITGKGGGTCDGRGVLRRQVPLWLEGVEFRSLVIGFDSAGIGHGGEGALYVRVRRGR